LLLVFDKPAPTLAFGKTFALAFIESKVFDVFSMNALRTKAQPSSKTSPVRRVLMSRRFPADNHLLTPDSIQTSYRNNPELTEKVLVEIHVIDDSEKHPNS
jgi:hypothetical protein